MTILTFNMVQTCIGIEDIETQNNSDILVNNIQNDIDNNQYNTYTIKLHILKGVNEFSKSIMELNNPTQINYFICKMVWNYFG